MPKITSKGQVTIPQSIRNSFAMLPGTFVDIIVEDNKVLLVKANRKNKFSKWVGRRKNKEKKDIDLLVKQMRGRIDE